MRQWVFGLPVIYYTTIIRGKGLPATWFWINVPYASMNVCLFVLFAVLDWYAVQQKIKMGRNEGSKKPDSGGNIGENEATSLLSSMSDGGGTTKYTDS